VTLRTTPAAMTPCVISTGVPSGCTVFALGACARRTSCRKRESAGGRPCTDGARQGLAISAVFRQYVLGSSVDAPSGRSVHPWYPNARFLRAETIPPASYRRPAGAADRRPWMGALVPRGSASRLDRQGACTAGVPTQREALDGVSRASRASVASRQWRRIAIPSGPIRRGPRLSRLHRDSRGKRSGTVELPPPVRAAESAGVPDQREAMGGVRTCFGGHPGLTVSEAKSSVARPAKCLAATDSSARPFCGPKGGVADEGGGAHGKRSAQGGLPLAVHTEASVARRSGCQWQAGQSQA
jgi:hypothetical protein